MIIRKSLSIMSGIATTVISLPITFLLASGAIDRFMQAIVPEHLHVAFVWANVVLLTIISIMLGIVVAVSLYPIERKASNVSTTQE